MSDVEKLIDMLDDSACRCHEAYLSRRMTDPNCNHDDAESWRELRAGVSELRRQLAEAEGVIQHYQMESHSAAMNHWRERAAAAEAKLALAEQNDRRYRWLRDHPRSTWETCYFKRQFVCKVPVALNTDPFTVSLDTAIDAAIAAGEGE